MKFRPQFSLRTLFVLITLVTTVAWAYWVGWPRWKIHCEQQRFIDSVKHIAAGAPVNAIKQTVASGLIPWLSYGISGSKRADSYLAAFIWPDEIFCIYYEVIDANEQDMNSGIIKDIELYRISTMPASYRAKYEQLATNRYIENAFHFFYGEHDWLIRDYEALHEFRFELLYADHRDKHDGDQQKH